MGALNVFTYSLIGSTLTISSTDNVQRVSVICSSGDVSVIGSYPFQGISPNGVSLSIGQGVTLSTKNDSTPIDGFTIDASGGVADIVISFQ